MGKATKKPIVFELITYEWLSEIDSRSMIGSGSSISQDIKISS